ncbi:MAG: hypothetical protein ABIQ93_16445, partial [Saprospiraceae bacterium]
MHDPNGFNAQGIHFETGNQYGPNGCSQAGFNAQGQPCQTDTIPYYWLQDSIGSQGAAQLLEDVQDSLPTWIHNMLNSWHTSQQATITQITAECQGIRTTMNGLVTALGYTADRELLFGPGDIYFNPGMWKKFSEEPKILNIELARDPNQILLESKHVDLYKCDKKLDDYAVFGNIVDSLLNNNGIPALTDAAKDLILGLSQDDAEYFKTHHDSLRNWIKAWLQPYLKSTFCNGTCSIQSLPAKSASPVEDGWGAIIQSLSAPVGAEQLDEWFQQSGSLSGVHENTWQSLLHLAQPDDALTAYLNGDPYINGIERAFFVEALGRAKEEAPFTVANAELMPIAVSNLPSDGKTYTIWLTNIHFTASSATLDAYFILELPNSGKKIAFSALNVSFTPNGFLSNPSIRLQLASDVTLRLNNAVQLTLKAAPETFIGFDCGGYNGIGLNLDVEVCRKYVKPLNPTSLAILPDPERVHTHIQVFLPTMDELYFEVNIDPFVITGLEDFKWIVNGIIVDFSDTKSPAYLPPAGYVSPFANANGFSPLWRGFYMANLTVQMPNQFNSGSAPLTVGVTRVLFDNMGVSGKVYAKPLLDLDHGNAGGWAFSVDEFSMTVLANQPVNAGFKGLIHVPVFSRADTGGNGGGGSNFNGGNNANYVSGCNVGAPTADDCFTYDAFIEPSPNSGQPVYRMTVNTGGNTMCANMWKSGQVIINSGSQINMIIENGAFKVEAKLNGKVKITEPVSGNVDVNIPEITFQNLIIRNQAPYFTPGTWGFPIPNQLGGSFGGFGLHIGNIAMIDNNGSPALKFDAGFKITDDNIGLKADGSFLIKGQLTNINGRQRWIYQSFQVTDIDLEGSFPGVEKVKGKLTFYEGDATYGTGWRGGVQLR